MYPLRVACVQIAMRADIAGNLQTIRAGLRRAAAERADLAIFPECALTGFHRGLRDAFDPAALAEAARGLQADCEALGLAAAVGTPWPGDRGVLNAALVLRPGEPWLVAPKAGLTESERRFFAPGAPAPLWRWRGWRLATLLCREVLDGPAAHHRAADALLWPGYIRWDAGAGGDDYLGAARSLARAAGAHVVQCNWPGSLNAPDTRGMGGSVWLDPAGALRGRASTDAPGVTLWELGPAVGATSAS